MTKNSITPASNLTSAVDAVGAEGSAPSPSSKQRLVDAASAAADAFATGKNDWGGRHSVTVHLPEGCFVVSIEAHAATPKDGE